MVVSEGLEKLSEFIEHIGSQMYRCFDQPSLLKAINRLTEEFIDGVTTEVYPQLFINLVVVFLTSACCQFVSGEE